MAYVSVENQKRIEPRYRMAMVIAIGLLSSVLVQMLIGRIARLELPVLGRDAWQRPIYTGILVLALVVIFLRRFLMARLVARRAAAGDVEGVLRSLTTVTILIGALAESVAILGLIFYFATGVYDYCLRLGGIGLLLLLYAFPRRGEWGRYVTACADGRN